MTGGDRPPAGASEVWLDFGQAASLVGLSMPRLVRLIDEGALATRPAPTGRPGLFKSELLAWHRCDEAERRAALGALAGAVDDEIFG